MSKLLALPHNLTKDTINELDPRTITVGEDAKEYWWDFCKNCEDEQKPGGCFVSIGEFANKLPEHAARLAAVLTLFEDEHAKEITLEMMENAVEIARYYADENIRMSQVVAVDKTTQAAHNLSNWLQVKHAGNIVAFSYIRQCCPRPRPSSAELRKLMKILETEEHVVKIPDGTPIGDRSTKEHYRVVPVD